MTSTESLKVLSPKNSLNASNVSFFTKSLVEAIKTEQVDEILIDLKDVELIDSSAVVTLVKATRSAQSEGKGLGLCHVNSQVRMILELTQLDRFVQMYKSETEFRQQHQMMAA